MLNRTKSPVNFKFSDITIQEPEKSFLDNGRPLYIFNQRSLPIVKLEFIFRRGGSLYDIKLGTNLILTKTIQSGTKNYSAQEISELIGQKGAFIDVSGSFDYSIISLYVLDKYLEDVIKVFKEVIINPTFPNQEISLQKEISINSLKTQNKKTNVLASKHFRHALFGNVNPYGKIISESDLISINEFDLKSEFDKSFKNNFEMIATGHITEEIRNVINYNFGIQEVYVSKNEENRYCSSINPKTTNTHIDILNSVQTSIRMGKKTINKKHIDYPYLVVVNHLLGGFFGSRLMSNLREEKGLTYGIHSSLVNFLNESYFVIGSDVKGENKSVALNEINNELTRLGSINVNRHELNLVKNHLLGSFQNDLSSPLELTDKFKNIYLNDLTYDFYSTFIKTIKSISAEEVRHITKKYFDPNSMTIVTAGA
jgi:zinc protease